MALTIKELTWSPGSYQWNCPVCLSTGNITPAMIREPSRDWHECRPEKPKCEWNKFESSFEQCPMPGEFVVSTNQKPWMWMLYTMCRSHVKRYITSY